MSAPSTVRRSQFFSISSSVYISCSTSLSTVKKWTVFKCNPQCSTPVLINGSMTLGEIVVPSNSLDYGVYQIKLTVAMTFSSQLAASAATYVTIVPSPIIVNLAKLGSSLIIHGQQKMLILDPGSYSIDPDFTFFDASVCHPFLSVSHSLLSPLLELELHVLLSHRYLLAFREYRRSNQSVVFRQWIR